MQKEEATSSHEYELSIQQNTLNHLKTLRSFPKIFHILWPDKNILNTTYQMLEHGAKNLQRLNPDWEFIVHDDETIDKVIKNFQHPDIPVSMNQDLASAHIVEKTDVFRLVIIYQMGGLYSDIDRAMNVNLSDAIKGNDTKMVIPTHYDVGFAQDQKMKYF